jgi:hypothetical protein
MHTKLLSSSSEEEEEEAENKGIHGNSSNSSSLSSCVCFCCGFVYKCCWCCGEELAGREGFQNGGEMREANTVVVL